MGDPLLPHLRQARDLADRRYADPLDLDALARAANVSKYHFSRRFAEAYGETPMRYLTRRRIERAQDLLPVAAEAFRRMLGKGSLGAVGLASDDCRKTYQELSAKGVEFIQEPSDRPYGVEAILRDDSGNWLVLVERKPYDGSEFPH